MKELYLSKVKSIKGGDIDVYLELISRMIPAENKKNLNIYLAYCRNMINGFDGDYINPFNVQINIYNNIDEIIHHVDEWLESFDNEPIKKIIPSLIDSYRNGGFNTIVEKAIASSTIEPKIDSKTEEKKEIDSNFDYTILLKNYDIKAIDGSLIKYYEAVQKWCYELVEKLEYYEKEKESVIRDFNIISLKLSKKYENNPSLTDKENSLLYNRQEYFKKNFSLGMNSIKTKILSVKKQADDLECRIDDIDNGNDSIHELALLEHEPRASFSFIAENTAKIIKNALLKIEFFESHYDFVKNAINIWETWTEDYKVFKTTYKEELKNNCEEDGIEEEIWSVWYNDWQQLRFAIEEKVQPIIERGIKGEMPVLEKTDRSIPELIIIELENFKNSIDAFYKEERKGIYQKFAFQNGGELQDKFETESSLYKYVAHFQAALQDIIFNCQNGEDRVFILNWASSLLDIQIDEIIDFVANNDLKKISQTILSEFAALKQKNYDIYLADAKSYSEEKTRREKEYNSLIFKMRKGLMQK